VIGTGTMIIAGLLNVLAPTFALEQTSVVQRCGAVLVVSYFEPTLLRDNGNAIDDGEVVLGTIERR
jgi:hypothetical protein